MGASGKTENYNLPIFNTGDTTAWADFNKAMTLLDETLKNIEVAGSNTDVKTNNNTNAISDIETSVESLQTETDLNRGEITSLAARTSVLEKHDNEQDLKIANVESVSGENSVKITEVETIANNANLKSETANVNANNALEGVNNIINRYRHAHVNGADKATSSAGTVTSCDIYYEITDYEDMEIIDFTVDISIRMTQRTELLTFRIPTLENILVNKVTPLATVIISSLGYIFHNTNGSVNTHDGMFGILNSSSLLENSDYIIQFSGRQFNIK